MTTKSKVVLSVIIICAITVLVANYESKRYEDNEDNNEDANVIEAEDIKEEEYINVWTIANVDIKNEPDVNSETVWSYYWNTEIIVTYVDDNWARVQDADWYIERDLLSDYSANYIDCDAPSNNTIKSYMDYKKITSTTSNQYKLQHSLAYTDSNGLRKVNGRYCIAVGSYYTTTIGQYIDVELENGKVISCILADCKADIHTDSTNRINPNGSVIEFVVDKDVLDYKAKIMGDISYLNEWNSKVVNIKVYDKVEEF